MAQARLLDIAICEFGSKGLDGASTRSIAAAANTAMSSITYHYGSKEGLYLAAADYIAAQLAAQMAPALTAEEGIGEDDPVAARAGVQRLIARFVDKMASDDTAAWSLFIMREQLCPGEAFDRIHAGLMGQLLQRMADLVCVATGVDGPAARLVTVTLMAQAVAVRASRASVLRLLDIDHLDAAALDRLKAQIATNIDAILDRMIAGEPQ